MKNIKYQIKSCLLYTSKKNKQQSNGDFSINNNIKIADLVKEAKESGADIVELLKKNLTVVEVSV